MDLESVFFWLGKMGRLWRVGWGDFLVFWGGLGLVGWGLGWVRWDEWFWVGDRVGG